MIGAHLSRRLPSRLGLALGLIAWLGGVSCAPAQQAGTRSLSIDLDHILQGGINSRGDLVGLHHRPSAPETLEVDGVECEIQFRFTSPGGAKDVRTANVLVVDPASGRTVREKFSTLYPDAWTAGQIEDAILDAFEEARGRDQIEDSGRWQGRNRDGVRIDGYVTRDRRRITTAFPVYTSRRNDRRPR